jgi:hypothetical protein
MTLTNSPDLLFLKLKNPHPRDERILFDEPTHTYTIDGNSNYTSVTTWNHGHFSAFNANEVIRNIRKGKKWGPQNKYFGMTDEQIKAMWEENRDSAATAGTAMHLNIECFYNNNSVEDRSIEYSYFLNFVADFPELTAYRTEWTVFHEKLRIAGSIDMLFIKPDGTYAIYDWKRSREISKSASFNKFANKTCIEHLPDSNYWHYCLQLNTYKSILESKYDIIVSEMYLICLHPENKNNNYQRIKVVDLGDEIKDLFKLRMLEIS